MNLHHHPRWGWIVTTVSVNLHENVLLVYLYLFLVHWCRNVTVWQPGSNFYQANGYLLLPNSINAEYGENLCKFQKACLIWVKKSPEFGKTVELQGSGRLWFYLGLNSTVFRIILNEISVQHPLGFWSWQRVRKLCVAGIRRASRTNAIIGVFRSLAFSSRNIFGQKQCAQHAERSVLTTRRWLAFLSGVVEEGRRRPGSL